MSTTDDSCFRLQNCFILKTAITRALLAGVATLSTLCQEALAQTPTPPPLPNVIASSETGNVELERNKATVVAFYDLMFNQRKPREAVERYVGATYTQHNPEVPDGKDAFIAFFEKMAQDHPAKQVKFKRVFAEGVFVTLHSEHVFPGWRGGSWAAMDIFRLDNAGRLVEHWDVLQKVPNTSANSNGMF